MKLNKFVKFLNKENIYDQFVKNMSDFKNMFLDEYWEKTNNPENAISDAFVWADSPEKYSFWKIIDERWKDFYNNPKYKDIESIDIPEYQAFWGERPIMKVYCPGIDRNSRMQLEEAMRKENPNICTIYKMGDYLYGTVKILLKIEKKLGK